MPNRIPSLGAALKASGDLVRMSGHRVAVEKWHGVPTEGKPDLVSIEVLDVAWSAPMRPRHVHEATTEEMIVLLRHECQPNLPWADDHFAERVSGEPLNPGEEYKNWPWYNPGNKWDREFRASGKFTHTYMERFWPKEAGEELTISDEGFPKTGLRYPLGDLADVVRLLIQEPHTRQAWLPVWFPEDTGAVHGGRVPCTLGYHFMLREGKLHLWYIIRSCDIVRYLRDDVYMACRLALWVLDQIQASDLTPDWDDVTLGDLHFHAFSLHMFEGDRYVRP